MTPKEFLQIRDEQLAIVGQSRARINAARAIADKCALPHNLRPATARDIVVNAILWYPHFSRNKWLVVDEVLYPNDAFKAFCADDGNRYGLDDAFVEIESGPTPLALDAAFPPAGGGSERAAAQLNIGR